ncbi:hypothetical protein GCM10010269_77210 [Streptomyces humidus]|uniref:Uncharacterized protein n=1 Tax=Streptomyces humidus TaxID=52259 RepID=A0A918LB54_9ACTN|nr:hypothetical protein [Streptomyces humidus]GGS27157.1 hypothetical protein GCM10010269_77210 [Streptomyces humidus]
MKNLVGAERSGRLLVVRMCQERKRNAIDRALADQLDSAIEGRTRPCRTDLRQLPHRRPGLSGGDQRVTHRGSRNRAGA